MIPKLIHELTTKAICMRAKRSRCCTLTTITRSRLTAQSMSVALRCMQTSVHKTSLYTPREKSRVQRRKNAIREIFLRLLIRAIFAFYFYRVMNRCEFRAYIYATEDAGVHCVEAGLLKNSYTLKKSHALSSMSLFNLILFILYFIY